MNTNERDAAEKWERRGWEIVRGGAPDFLLVKRLAGRIVEARTIEVKTSGDQLKPNQIVWGEALGAYGIPFTVARRFNVGGPIAPLRADEASSGLSPPLRGSSASVAPKMKPRVFCLVDYSILFSSGGFRGRAKKSSVANYSNSIW